MGGAPAPAPMDGASDIPAGEMGSNGPEGGPAGAPMDGMGGDVPPDGNGELDPNMGGGPGMEGEPPMNEPEGEEGDDSTMSLFNQLSDEDKKAARGYIESMISRDESNGPEDGGEMPPMDGPEGGDPNASPMMETVIFRKGQLRAINENLLTTQPEDDKNNAVEKKKGGKLNKKSPFNSPKFN